MTPVIEVRVMQTGDSAECDSPEAAVLAAMTMGQEARDAAATWGFDPRMTFAVDGKIVRSATLRELSR